MKLILETIYLLWSGLLDLFLPVHCIFCSETVNTYRWNLPICLLDYQRLPQIQGPVCQVCGLPLGNEVFELSYDINPDPAPVCGSCRSRKNLLEFTLAPFAYSGRMREIIHCWKFDPAEQWGPWLGTLLSYNLPEFLPGENWEACVPIPLECQRKLERGFNQARQLAEKLSDKYELSVSFLLEKNQQTVAQSLLSREERLTNPSGTFDVPSASNLKNRNLIIVDDIYTTGATIREAARVLKEGGARRIAAIVLARSLPVSPDYGKLPPENNCLPL